MKAFTSTLATTALLASSVVAQYRIEPDSVDNSTRQFWCQQQTTECPLICLQPPANSAETLQNSCDWESLTFSCVCADGLSPNVSEYSQTLPYFICTEWGTQCVSNCGGDNSCAAACQQDHPCGALDPERKNTTAVASTMTQTTTTTGAPSGATVDTSGQTIYTGFAEGGASPTSGSGDSGSSGDSGNGGSDGGSGAASIMLSTGRACGTFVVFGLLTLAFAVLL